MLLNHSEGHENKGMAGTRKERKTRVVSKLAGEAGSASVGDQSGFGVYMGNDSDAPDSFQTEDVLPTSQILRAAPEQKQKAVPLPAELGTTQLV